MEYTQVSVGDKSRDVESGVICGRVLRTGASWSTGIMLVDSSVGEPLCAALFTSRELHCNSIIARLPMAM